MTTLIVWRRAKQPKRDGHLKHRIVVSGPLAQEVHDWFGSSNSQGQWRLGAVTRPLSRNPQTGAIKSMGEPTFDCELWAAASDGNAQRQAEREIMLFKLAWHLPEGEVCWRQHWA